ncbi:putative quinol monooxygenase [Clostridium beijerinckii]|uniref:Quinol monooxygenase YgiN n=1 Tax=Clostridium beijerinckii TaxID=1520 RepID=A0AAX0AVD4_CLOBE|nr:antibiotic biosynthesis monooxygenase [Clostridium beijerinckii]NOW04833.1 quinol monooxygenase YgiN [Clostridium beijerinckii]NRT87015.1 quinol monooxygenase YgiN [Clostridium beijerinckii]NYC02025.1 quinol monooxygenase YgiN [Clostridium beijerinckii]NYC72448.1 quinol monooxygenase YgiN [Clostridium beijerinckii]
MIATEKGNMMISPKQPGTVLKMRAKAGKGDALFELTNKLHYNGDPDGPVDWILCRDDKDSDILWAFEFYKDLDSFIRHFTNPAIEAGHDEVLELLAEMPMRVEVHTVYSSFQAK